MNNKTLGYFTMVVQHRNCEYSKKMIPSRPLKCVMLLSTAGQRNLTTIEIEVQEKKRLREIPFVNNKKR